MTLPPAAQIMHLMKMKNEEDRMKKSGTTNRACPFSPFSIFPASFQT
jgi:hypothetical protein